MLLEVAMTSGKEKIGILVTQATREGRIEVVDLHMGKATGLLLVTQRISTTSFEIPEQRRKCTTAIVLAI